MQTFDQAIIRAFEAGLITEETAVIYSTRKAVVQRGLDMVKQKRGEKTTDIEGLKLDVDYDRKLKK
jgi:twitching motility protein PilT